MLPVETSCTAPGSDPSAGGDRESEGLRGALVSQLIQESWLTSATVERAMRTVPRHLFVPGASLEAAYAQDTVAIKQDSQGRVISCASHPAIVAQMLEQLDVQPAHRILELGTGTGYNAGLLAFLAGPEGLVTTVDVDDDLVDQARTHLTAAGFSNVSVVMGDGALGHLAGAPYDRIVATVGAHGVPRAWFDQLAEGGRLLTPQRLRGSVCRSLAWERDPARAGSWVSVSSEMNTFMPLRKGVADDAQIPVPLTEDGRVALQTHPEHDLDANAFTGVLTGPRAQVWTDVRVEGMESPEWMELYLTLTLPNGLNRLIYDPSAVKDGLLAESPYRSSGATFTDTSIAYLVQRPSTTTSPEGRKLWDFGVVAHGPDRSQLAEQMITALNAWNTECRPRTASFRLRHTIPNDETPHTVRTDSTFRIRTPLNEIDVVWA
ncbi:methyltransferase, FxLD system [Kineosporia sp. NBRC 101731]|uniref:methyltransferase, FxLD system n=1 Tax=Kineosporia sp. NBRC 101731 TaxID=3032199 RepID=UPI0024A3DC72|nr:methyltransferase, FxLD system [Kineosporia sp. NBRC 101731]GLY33440.1 hypothetical protein Kisp02_68050 [Kineosporia sp. NBRC 101731]